MADDIIADIRTQEILLASANHDVETLTNLLKNGSANVQDPETGYTPLHSAIAACAPDDAEIPSLYGDASEGETRYNEELQRAERILKLLFLNGAIWNELDANNETPGCLAWRLNLKSLYEIVVDAGVRAELLLNRLDEYKPLADDEDEEQDQGELNGFITTNSSVETKESDQPDAFVDGVVLLSNQSTASNSMNHVSQSADIHVNTRGSTTNVSYLKSELTFQNDRILDSNKNGVMMIWEQDIMQHTADLIIPKPNLAVLNIGHGMGIIDDIMQSKSPSSHHIIEAHPNVLDRMQKDGWLSKTNVTVHAGTWQDVLPRLVEEDVTFDAIFFDTFAEDYKTFRYFFNEYLISLLSPEGRWSFFHGLGADRQVCYDVYTKLVEMDLFEVGFDTEFHIVETPNMEESKEWEGVKRPYWAAEKYRLPVCTFIG